MSVVIRGALVLESLNNKRFSLPPYDAHNHY
jgi:hypothetical protein